MFRKPQMPARPWALFWGVGAVGMLALWVVSRFAGEASHWTEAAFGALMVLLGSLVIADWQGVATYLVRRRTVSPPPWAGWVAQKVDPEDRRRVVRGFAWAGIVFGGYLTISAVVHAILGR